MNNSDSYYNRFKEERKAYQKTYYDEHKELLRRKKELDAQLRPEKTEHVRNYQRNYYLTNRQKLLERKRLRYIQDKDAGNL